MYCGRQDVRLRGIRLSTRAQPIGSFNGAGGVGYAIAEVGAVSEGREFPEEVQFAARAVDSFAVAVEITCGDAYTARKRESAVLRQADADPHAGCREWKCVRHQKRGCTTLSRYRWVHVLLRLEGYTGDPTARDVPPSIETPTG